MPLGQVLPLSEPLPFWFSLGSDMCHMQGVWLWRLVRGAGKHADLGISRIWGQPHPLPLHAAAAAKLLQSCPTLCDLTDGSPPGSSLPGILQARILECVAISYSNACRHAKLLQSCPTLCNPMDSSPPGSSVHGILQARILEWVAMPFSALHANLGL